MTGSSTDPAPADVLSLQVGDRTVGENLEAAISEGRVTRRDDGRLELRAGPRRTYIGNPGYFGPNCTFLNNFAFTQLYGGKAVPIGCRDCYKVKVEPATLRQLLAVDELAQDFDCASKSGSEVDKTDTPSAYANYFYAVGLEAARAIYRRLRVAIDAHPKLGADVHVFIKRGCSNYERAVGPSDRYTFDPRLAAVEAHFEQRFAPPAQPARKYRRAMARLHLVRTAYRIGDETYKDLTDGKELLPPLVTYDPEPS